ncbi:RNA polymerase [Pedobacter kyungheensis]|uniref:RNA polymerase sigma-70 factor, ECF subfamily n=2 Tax=Pedobacter TaxID=84567 RepID=A0A1G7B2U5_9SPHI|nr:MULTISPECIES: RNA polymerase sigma factor [Pedobacter]KIA91500.1 RNA polymerase [Pedobacter kyungheensis]SDE21262.1 RNA polymerase sigma-70 factor, ECF subfamily [Pedobacter soli]
MVKKILSFEEILKGCVKNDNGCKEMMYKSFYGYLMGIILRYTKNPSDSEELVNDTFIKIFKHVGTFKAPKNPEELQRSFKGWIAQIASRTAIDKIRSSKIQFYVDDLAEHEHPVTQVSVASELHVNDILNLLNHLPDTQRLVFNLYEIEGFAHDEISKMLNIPESSSRVYLTRSKNKLRTLYLNTLVNSYEKNG